MKESNKHIDFFEDELKDSELLSKLKGKNSFDIPDDYFQNLESDILGKIDTATTLSRKLYSKYLLIAVAASIAFIMVFVGLHIVKTQKQKPQLVDNTPPEVETIVKERIELSDNSSNTEIHIINDSISNEIIAPSSNSEKISLAIDNNREVNPKAINNNTLSSNNIIKEKMEDDSSPQNIPVVVIADNGSNSSSAISNPKLHNSSQRTVRAIARISNNTNYNVFLPKDTCVNSPFLLIIDSTDASNLSFIWNNNEGISNRFLESGNYYLQYWLNDSLLGVDSMQVVIVAKPEPFIKTANEICNHESLLLNSGINSDIYNYKWSVSDLNTSEIYINNLEPGENIIKLEVSSCADTVETQVAIYVNDCHIMIPNVFTPNGDGINDMFFVKGLNYYPGSSLTVFDRKGNVVFQAMDYQNNWKAKNVKAGTYFYSLKINDEKKTEKGGVINIVR